MKSRSLAGPIILISLGALFLMSNIMPEISIWQVLDYWPVLLIVFGFIRLIEVVVAMRRGNLRTSEFRPVGFGLVAALVAIGLVLSLPHHINRGTWRWGPIRSGSVEFLGQDFDYPVTVETPRGAAGRLVLDGVRGNLSIKGSADGAIRVNGHKIIRAFDREAADRANGRTQIELSPEGSAIILRARESGGEQSHLSIDLEMEVPRGMDIEARGRSGDLSIDSMDGAVQIFSQKGEVRLNEIKGNASLDVERCDVLRAMNVGGTLNVQGNGRDLQIESVGGQVTVNGRFSGTLDFRNLAKPLHFESEQTDFRVEKLPGTINMDLGNLRATNLIGPIRFVTRSRDVELDEFAGPVTIELERGNVDLKPSKPLAPIDVRTRGGDVELELPAGSAFSLKARTKGGEVTNDFGEKIVAETEGRESTMRSVASSGPEVSLITDRGSITIRKTE